MRLWSKLPFHWKEWGKNRNRKVTGREESAELCSDGCSWDRRNVTSYPVLSHPIMVEPANPHSWAVFMWQPPYAVQSSQVLEDTKIEAEHCFWAVSAVREVCSPRSGCCSLRLEQVWPHSFKQTSHSVKCMCLILNIMPEKQVSAIQAELSDFANGGMFAEDNLLLDVLCGQNQKCLAVMMLICFSV